MSETFIDRTIKRRFPKSKKGSKLRHRAFSQKTRTIRSKFRRFVIFVTLHPFNPANAKTFPRFPFLSFNRTQTLFLLSLDFAAKLLILEKRKTAISELLIRAASEMSHVSRNVASVRESLESALRKGVNKFHERRGKGTCGRSRGRSSFVLVFVSAVGNPPRDDDGDSSGGDGEGEAQIGFTSPTALKASRPQRGLDTSSCATRSHSRSVCGPRAEAAKSLVAAARYVVRVRTISRYPEDRIPLGTHESAHVSPKIHWLPPRLPPTQPDET